MSSTEKEFLKYFALKEYHGIVLKQLFLSISSLLLGDGIVFLFKGPLLIPHQLQWVLAVTHRRITLGFCHEFCQFAAPGFRLQLWNSTLLHAFFVERGNLKEMK